MMKISSYSRILGRGGYLCGGLAGLLFLLYPHAFPRHSTLEGVMLIGTFLGAAFQPLADTLVIKPLLYYARLLQLILLKRYIGERTQNLILCELTIKHFLGEHPCTCLAHNSDEERDACKPKKSCLSKTC